MDPDLQIRKGEGRVGHPDPEIWGGGGPGRPGPSPGSATDRGPLNRGLTV